MTNLIEKQMILFTRICNSYDNFRRLGSDKMTKGSCISRRDNLINLWEQFNINNNKILEDETIEAEDDYFSNNLFDKTEEAYLCKLGEFHDRLMQFEGAETVRNANQVQNPIIGRDEKLPPIQLPIFDGDIREWSRFKDTFNEMIVKKVNLPNIYKMNYLHQFIQGEAKDVLSEVPSSGDNFEAAWKAIKDHYDNNRLISTKLLSKLCSMPAMESLTSQEVSRIKTSTSNILQAL